MFDDEIIGRGRRCLQLHLRPDVIVEMVGKHLKLGYFSCNLFRDTGFESGRCRNLNFPSP